MGSVTKYLEKQIPGVYVHSLMIGDNVVQDTENGFFMNINSQIELACQRIQEDHKLKDGYHAVGSLKVVCFSVVWPRGVLCQG